MGRIFAITWICIKYLVVFWCIPTIKNRTLPERIRLAIQDLGLTFIKAGQMIASSQLIQGPIPQELRKLFDQITPIPFPTVQKIIEKELGEKITAAFTTFGVEPIASASIAQVHRGTLSDGTTVAIKVRRPGVAQMVKKDIRIAKTILFLLSLCSRRIYSIRSARVFEHMEHWLLQEVDLRKEAESIGEFYAFYADNPSIVFPRMIFGSSPRLLITEFLEGVPLNRWNETQEKDPTMDVKKSLKALLAATFGPLFKGIPVRIHGDPHPGNLIIMKNGKIGVVDLGFSAFVAKEDLVMINEATFSVFIKDANGLMETALQGCGISWEDINPKQFKKDIEHYINQAATKPFTYWLLGMAKVLIKHHIPLPEAFNIVARFGIIMDGVMQNFFPNSPTGELLETELREGIIHHTTVSLRSLDPLALLWIMSRTAKKIPKITAQFAQNPTRTAGEWVAEFLEPIRFPA